MYNPSHFVEQRPELLAEFIEAHPLAILISSDREGPQATHVPMVLHRDSGKYGLLRCHLARANTQWKSITDSTPVLAVFSGAEHYITPNWYPSTAEHGKVVPTWNYLTVHVRGVGRELSDDELLAHLKELTTRHEQPFPEPWTVDGAPADFIQALRKAIVGIEIEITSLEGKWKASQNRNEADRAGVIDGLTELKTPASLEMSEVVKLANQAKSR